MGTVEPDPAWRSDQNSNGNTTHLRRWSRAPIIRHIRHALRHLVYPRLPAGLGGQLHDRMRMRRFLPLLALLAAACQPLPHPFAGDVPQAAMLSPRDSAGIYVAPVAGAPTSIAGDLAEAMAAALRDADIPASTRGRNKGSYELRGAASEQPLPGGRVEVSVDWELRTADGRSLGHAPSAAEQSAAGWPGSDTVAPEIAAVATPAIRKLVQDDAPITAAEADPAVSLPAVTGAPGDGGRPPTPAVGDALRRARGAPAAPGADAPSV